MNDSDQNPESTENESSASSSAKATQSDGNDHLNDNELYQKESYAGHPNGLYLLFFAEMWERFSYYGMRALLVLYMTKGFLQKDDNSAYAIYGAYAALVYATPFIGGMIADHLIGARRAVILGGLLMALGHLVMTIESELPFYFALAFLIVGNGFFKPNISMIVGSLYPEHSTKRDAGFTIFYIGINLGAAMAPLICGYVGENYGWHYGFGLATIGMLVGLALFVVPASISRFMILLTALLCGGAMIYLNYDEVIYALGPNVFVALCLIASGVIGYLALSKVGLPVWAGEPAHPERLKEPAAPELSKHLSTYYLAIICTILLLQHLVPPQSFAAFVLLCVGFYALIFPWLKVASAIYLGSFIATPVFALLVQRNEIAGIVLSFFGIAALTYLILQMFRSTKVERERLQVILVLMFFSGLFWAFFEQAGSSINLYTDRNVDRVFATEIIKKDQIGQTITVEITQGMTGRSQQGKIITVKDVDIWRYQAKQEQKQKEIQRQTMINTQDGAHAKKTTTYAWQRFAHWIGNLFSSEPDPKKDQQAKSKDPTMQWTVHKDSIGMPIKGSEVAASQFQAANPIFIIIFGLIFSALWSFLGRLKIEPSTPTKFGLGILQLGLGFAVLEWAALNTNALGMAGMGSLMLAYLLMTTGELCLSPVGLSMVTRLAPKSIVSIVMGAWFLATAFSNYLAALIAMLTGIEHGSGGVNTMPPPQETVHVYAKVFGPIALVACACAVIVFLLTPTLKRWMHEDSV
jgi:proton-dependent oligopeptide transporter, POT family